MIILDWPNEWPWNCCEKNLDEDDDVESEKEEDAMEGAESSAKNPANKFHEPSLGEAIALLREAIPAGTATLS